MEAIKNIIPAVLEQFKNPAHDSRQKLWSEWTELVGVNIARHTRPSLGMNGTLFIWVDQSALAFELTQKYKHVLLKRVRAVVGDEIKSIVFRVGELR